MVKMLLGGNCCGVDVEIDVATNIKIDIAFHERR